MALVIFKKDKRNEQIKQHMNVLCTRKPRVVQRMFLRFARIRCNRQSQIMRYPKKAMFAQKNLRFHVDKKINQFKPNNIDDLQRAEYMFTSSFGRRNYKLLSWPIALYLDIINPMQSETSLMVPRRDFPIFGLEFFIALV